MSLERCTIVEWDLPFCTHVFGNAPCTAALLGTVSRKCFNMFASCADQANYNPEPLTIRFAHSQSGLPRNMGTIFPLLRNVSEVESTVNIAGSDPNISAFGRRATITVDFNDMAYHDRLFDKYAEERKTGAAQTDEGGYDPETRGTFWTKLKARFPFYAGSAFRVLDGFIDNGAFIEDARRHYIVTSFETTEPGRCKIEAKDILDVAGNDRALAPKPSRGRLAEDIDDAAMSFTLTPEGIGDIEYPATGWGSVGNEIMRFSRAGDLVTILERGSFATEVRAHRNLDTFQVALRIDGERIDQVYNRLLTEFTPVPSSFIPLSEWQAEADVWAVALFLDAIITRPTAVSALIAEIAALGASVWWEASEQKVGFKMNRPPYLDTVWRVTDSDLYSIRKDDRDDRRLTDVLFNSVQIDPTKALADDNFLRTELTVSGDAKDFRAYGDQRIKNVNIRWLNQGNQNVIRIASIRYLQRFDSTPTKLTLEVPGVKYRGVKLTDVIDLETTAITDDTGKPDRQLWEVTNRTPKRDGHLVLQCQRYFLDVGDRPAYFMENDTPDYDDATEEQRAFGWFFTSENDPEFEPYRFI